MRIALVAGLAVPGLTLSACKVEQNADREAKARVTARAQAKARQVQASCASNATDERLKQVLFDEAIRVRNADPANLDKLATYSKVRIENPTVKSRDEALDVTVCAGSLILQLPPGAERGFAGQHKLQAEVEFAAQRAADGSGLVFRIKGAEPIVYKLAAFDLRGQTYRAPPVESFAASEPAGAVLPPPTSPVPALVQPPVRRPDPRPSASFTPRPRAPSLGPDKVRPAQILPSFDCRRARTRSERMVCADANLAALDRAMSSQFYSALSNANRQTRGELRGSRDRFLAYRDRCPDAACVAMAYRDRMDEIRDLAGY